MTALAIDAHGLSKAYRIGVREPRPETLAGALASAFRAPLTNLRRLRSLTNFSLETEDAEDVVWALRDVALQVEQGEVLGIIGRNGAGKSTLLKVLSGITEPTAGEAIIRGRVASLLEVGSGFHPDLTGRENTYLNGTILGMSKWEVDQKFDEIVAFAEVDRFIDTPIKWYSSGMALRLAFAVAAHLEADILLVDEVLAVGDASFQRKCLGRMQGLASAGRTVLFVSHNMGAIVNLCKDAIRIQDGSIRSRGSAHDIVESYLGEMRPGAEQDLRRLQRAIGSGEAMMRHVRLCSNGKAAPAIKTGDPLEILVDIECGRELREGLSIGFQISDAKGQSVFGTNTIQYDLRIRSDLGSVTVMAKLEDLMLAPGMYGVSLFLGSGFLKDLEVIREAIFFNVIWSPRRDAITPPNEQWGPVFMPVRWEVMPCV